MTPTKLNTFLGLFSLGLGAAEIFYPGTIKDKTGVRSEALIKAFGLREVASAGVLLAAPSNPAGPLGRVGGDILDIVAAGREAFRKDNPARGGAIFALAFVGGALLLDAYATYRTAQITPGQAR